MNTNKLKVREGLDNIAGKSGAEELYLIAHEGFICINPSFQKRKESRIPPNTRINTSWAVRTWSEWAVERNGMIAIKGESAITLPQVNPNILNITDNEEFNYWLSKLVVEVRKKKDPGTVYLPNTLYHIRDNGRPELNFFTDPSFKHFQDCLDTKIKRFDCSRYMYSRFLPLLKFFIVNDQNPPYCFWAIRWVRPSILDAFLSQYFFGKFIIIIIIIIIIKTTI